MTLTTLQLSKTDRSVSYLDQGEGEPLLLIHGVGMQHAAWHPQIKAFASTHRVIAVDMPGHGGSTPLPIGSQLPEFVSWLNDFLTDLNCGLVNIAGHSMGALITGGFVATHPDKVLRVALLNGVYCRPEPAKEAVLKRAKEIASGGVDLSGPLDRWFGNSPKEQEVRKKTEVWLKQMDQESYSTTYEAFAKGDATYAECWKSVLCPALFLTGEGDPNSTPAMSSTMAKTAPKGKVCIIEGHKHMANLTTPMDVNAALKTWLNEPILQGGRS